MLPPPLPPEWQLQSFGCLLAEAGGCAWEGLKQFSALMLLVLNMDSEIKKRLTRCFICAKWNSNGGGPSFPSHSVGQIQPRECGFPAASNGLIIPLKIPSPARRRGRSLLQHLDLHHSSPPPSGCPFCPLPHS